jgi:hypothetical protein
MELEAKNPLQTAKFEKLAAEFDAKDRADLLKFWEDAAKIDPRFEADAEIYRKMQAQRKAAE